MKTLEQTLGDQFTSGRSAVEDTFRGAETYVRDEPIKAVLWAVAAGYLLRLLPVAAIINAVVRALVAMIKPVAFLYGAAKLWDMLQANASRQANSGSGEGIPS